MLDEKDFKAVTEILAANRNSHLGPGGIWRDGRDSAAESIAEETADYFATQNLRFDRERFMKACGLEGGE